MNSLFNDPYGDRHARISKIYALPENFNMKEAGDRPSNALRWCAQPEKTLYPTDSPERTVVSWCHANEDRDLHGGTRERVLGNIKEAAEWWGVELPRASVLIEEPTYSFTVKHANDEEDEHHIYTSRELLHFAEEITKNAADYNFDTRHQVAEAILRAPSVLRKDFSRELLEDMERMAGDAMVSKYDVKAACDIRAGMLEDNRRFDLARELRRMGDSFTDRMLDRDTVIKIAREMDTIDRAAELTTHYHTGRLLPAELSLEGAPFSQIKEAAEDMVVIDKTTVTSRRAIAAHRKQVDDFFLKLAGEDTTGISVPELIDKLEGMDDIMREAFIDLSGSLCSGEQ